MITSQDLGSNEYQSCGQERLNDGWVRCVHVLLKEQLMEGNLAEQKGTFIYMTVHSERPLSSGPVTCVLIIDTTRTTTDA